MKIKELVEQLLKYEQELDVLMASDEEGNVVNYVYEVAYSPMLKTEDKRDITLIHPDDVGTEYDEEYVITALVIWPY